MNKSVKVEFDTGDNNISIRNTNITDDGTKIPVIEVNIGGWQDNIGGNDGQSVFLTADEFSEFIRECTALLKLMQAGE